MLDLCVAEGLRAYGHGNLSVGVALAAEKAAKTSAANASAALHIGTRRASAVRGEPYLGVATSVTVPASEMTASASSAGLSIA